MRTYAECVGADACIRPRERIERTPAAELCIHGGGVNSMATPHNSRLTA